MMLLNGQLLLLFILSLCLAPYGTTTQHSPQIGVDTNKHAPVAAHRHVVLVHSSDLQQDQQLFQQIASSEFHKGVEGAGALEFWEELKQHFPKSKKAKCSLTFFDPSAAVS